MVSSLGESRSVQDATGRAFNGIYKQRQRPMEGLIVEDS